MPQVESSAADHGVRPAHGVAVGRQRERADHLELGRVCLDETHGAVLLREAVEHAVSIDY